MDIGGIITGVVVALIAAIIVPFVTSEYSLWSAHRRQLVADRRSALANVLDAEGNQRARFAREVDDANAKQTARPAHFSNESRSELATARQKLSAMFTTSDALIAGVFEATVPENPWHTPTLDGQHLVVLATWAAGRNIRARHAARRLIEHLEQQQGTPEGDSRGQTNSKANEHSG